ncbi:MAG: Saccharopine dehydrogenase [Geoglossum simile]|nr:MAG: Saccharopine dehydrogenase [Geoglossum simile]
MAFDDSPVWVNIMTEDLFRSGHAVSPTTAKALLDAGYVVNAKRSSGRVFGDEEFEAVGATPVPTGSWVNAPKDHIIVGLKELLESDAPLHHSHVQFGHCYKYQENWDRYLSRFARGGGTLYNIEFLTDNSGRRVSAFGYYAGYAGAAVALLAWAHQVAQPTTPLPSISTPPSATALEAAVNASLTSALLHNDNKHPRVLIMGALGRCGTGAIDFCIAAGIPTSNLLKWDMAETAAGGPFPEIAAADIFINCVYLLNSREVKSVLDRRDEEGVWVRAEKVFRDKVGELPASMVGEQDEGHQSEV